MTKSKHVIELPALLFQRLEAAAAMHAPCDASALAIIALTAYVDDHEKPRPVVRLDLDPTTKRCVVALREAIELLEESKPTTGLTAFSDSSTAPAHGGYATRSIELTVTTSGGTP